MNQPLWQALRAPRSRTRLWSSRFIAGRRRPLPAYLHTSIRKLAEDDEPKPQPETLWQPLLLDSNALVKPVTSPEKQGGSPPDGEPSTPSKPPVDPSHYGSALRRASRNVKKVIELPRADLPGWIFDRNVELIEDRASDPVVDGQLESWNGNKKRKIGQEPVKADGRDAQSSPISSEASSDTYLLKQMRVHQSTIDEIASLVQAGLRVPTSENTQNTSYIKHDIHLCTPKRGCSAYLATFVQELSRQHEADFLRLSPQDIAEIGGQYFENKSDHLSPISSLAYDVAQAAFSQAQAQAPEEEYSEQDEYEPPEEGAPEEEGRERPKMPGSFASAMSQLMGMPVKIISNTKLDDFFNPNKLSDWNSAGPNSKSTSKGAAPGQTFTLHDDTPDMMMTLLIETLLNAPEIKRRRGNVYAGDSNAHRNKSQDDADLDQRGENKLVVLIEDYHHISMTQQGSAFLRKLHDVVEARRKEGQAVLVVGATSSDKLLVPGDSKGAIDDAQAQSWAQWMRNVVVPVRSTSDDGLFWNEHKRRIRQINLRNLRDMLRKVTPDQALVSQIVDDWDLSIDSKFAFLGSLDRSAWPSSKVNRIATIALGMLPDSGTMTPNTIGEALATIDASDSSKYRWHRRDIDKSKPSKESSSATTTKDATTTQSERLAEERLKKLRKKCNRHEKKLLNGVVDSKSIRTTFSDVHVPQETIKAIKTLTSLSLIRPEAFTYGVLAHDRIPGILLYGPPGTGKTLLAKAVAKESGATVLEVSGSDVYDMYVGEGEKNVRAIFSLARKLSPCVVFIDEADAILGSRSSGHARTSHRELVNQFLREWDGVTDTNAFIMIATNRPYDLDEASLRRVPRRLLVDLPTEKDREAILRIHLKDEVLSSEVDVAKLAEQTPFYSGSDLKNLCVAAALGCVREEYEASLAAQHTATASSSDSDTNTTTTPTSTPESPSTPPATETETASKEENPQQQQEIEKRILLPRHFDAALQEISASISEDMGSLGAIRKFDEKYGDRRGRRKGLKGGYGFGLNGKVEGEGKGEGRVRREV